MPVPEAVEVCLAEAEELLSVRDRITSALAARVGRVHRAGEAKNHGHASTKLWLRSAGGMTPAGAGRLVTMGMELDRLPQVRERFAEGSLPEGVVEAICTATAGLTDEQAATAERILLELAVSAGAAEVAKAGRYLRAVLDPDGHEQDEHTDFDRRFFRIRRRRNGGLEGEFYLPVEAAARLQHLLDVYAKPKAEGDDRPLSVRNADAFIAFLENKIATELLVLVTAESLPDDPTADHATSDPAGTNPSGTDPGDDPTPAPDSSSKEPDLSSDSSAPAANGPGFVPSDADSEHSDPGHPVDGLGSERFTSDTPVLDGEHPDLGHSATAPGSEDRAGDAPVRDGGRCGSDVPEHSTTGGPAAGWPHFDSAHGDERADRGNLGDFGDAREGHADQAEMQRHRAGSSQCTPSRQAHAPDPPPEHGDTPDTQAEDRPAKDCPGGCPAPGCPGGDCPVGDCRAGDYRHAFTPGEVRGMPGAGADAWPGAERNAPPDGEGDSPPEAGPDAPPWAGGSTWPGAGGNARSGGEVWPGVGGNVPPGVWLRGLPGLILATGHLLPASSVHRLARTSTLVRIVMNAAGQVLDMGRKVRLATPAQRRAVFARYATCWVDGCPLPATMCQIDHCDNWCSGGLTDLNLLGPACQFHNRDRYRHPTRYTRRKVGDDRWAFTYRNPRTTRRVRT
ncbi:DUF222 domain-containing protein [Microbispora sp. NBC_01389]|uniref:DUF222 domain-containing protein n=1 Tax=Microbispora sp. NBC_01389 TaxID=2903584 RepID=UPI0032482B8E